MVAMVYSGNFKNFYMAISQGGRTAERIECSSTRLV